MTAAANVFAHPASRLSLQVFRLNGALIAAGDALVAPLGLTSARWQVMGAVAEARGGLPVAGIARNMGLVRQVGASGSPTNSRRRASSTSSPNPHHRRAKLVQLTERGAALFDAASQAGWHWPTRSSRRSEPARSIAPWRCCAPPASLLQPPDREEEAS